MGFSTQTVISRVFAAKLAPPRGANCRESSTPTAGKDAHFVAFASRGALQNSPSPAVILSLRRQELRSRHERIARRGAAAVAIIPAIVDRLINFGGKTMLRLAPRTFALVAVCFGLLLFHENVARGAEQPTQEPRSLFNGKDLTGWHADVPALDKDPDGTKPFVVRDGMLVSLGTPGGHLISDDEHANYRLDVQYRFAAKPGNCGVLVHASKPRALYDMFPQSIEVQMQSQEAGDFWCICENIETPDMETRRGPRTNGASTAKLAD
jgi:hypothetical protein